MTALTLDNFKSTPNGRRIGTLLGRPVTISAMERLSQQGQPAVLAVDEALEDGIRLDDVEKRHVGRWIRDVLADRGWRPRKRLHFRSGRIFSSGAVYCRPPEPTPALAQADPDIAERVARVQEMVRAFRRDDYDVDDFLRDKRAEAAREL